MTTRIGPKMRLAAAFVADHPGCVMRECAHAVSPHPFPSRNEALGYNIVHRAIAAGLIDYTTRGGRYYLYTPEQAREERAAHDRAVATALAQADAALQAGS